MSVLEKVVSDTKYRAKKADMGHTAVRIIERRNKFDGRRTYELHCQCGKVYTSRTGLMTVLGTHERHQKKAAR